MIVCQIGNKVRLISLAKSYLVICEEFKGHVKSEMVKIRKTEKWELCMDASYKVVDCRREELKGYMLNAEKQSIEKN